MKKFIYLFFCLSLVPNLFTKEKTEINKPDVKEVVTEPVLNKDKKQDEKIKKDSIDVDVNLLIEKATQARESAYCPYSKFKVGAALLSESGKIYTGCNVENSSYGLTNCAERTAIFNMINAGEKKIKAIAIVLEAEDYGAPCGACRQVIYEFGQNTDVIMATVNGKHKVVKIKELLPYAFCLEE